MFKIITICILCLMILILILDIVGFFIFRRRVANKKTAVKLKRDRKKDLLWWGCCWAAWMVSGFLNWNGARRMNDTYHMQCYGFLFLAGIILTIILVLDFTVGKYAYVTSQRVYFPDNFGLARQKAYKDGLTGVKNKLAYLEMLAELETALESGELTEYGVVVFDVNGLKMINDTLGHEAGDEYIKRGCSIICQHFDHSPVFRIGGDEFVAILKGRDYANREFLLESFRRVISENQENGSVIVASGLAVYDTLTDSSYNDVFKRADKSMYEQKRSLKAAAAQVS